MSHAFNGQQFGRAKRLHRLQSTAISHQPIRGAVHDERGNFEARQGFTSILVGENRQRLPDEPLRGGSPLEVQPSHGAVKLALELKVRLAAADLAEQPNPRFPCLLGRARPRTQHRPQCAGVRKHRESVTGVGHDRCEGSDPLGVRDRHSLRDHSAHRSPHDVRSRPAQGVQHGERIVGEIGELVGSLDVEPRRPPQHGLAQRGHTQVIQPRGFAHVAIVEASHGESPLREHVAQPLRPQHLLCAQAHHQQQRRPLPAEVVVQLQRAGGCGGHRSRL